MAPIVSVVAFVPNGVNVAEHVTFAVEPDNGQVENVPAPVLLKETVPVGEMNGPAVEVSVTVAVQFVGLPTVTGEAHATDVTVDLSVTLTVAVASGLAAE